MKKTFALIFLLLFFGLAFSQEIGNPSKVQSVDAIVTVRERGTISGTLGSGRVTLEAITFKETKNQKIKEIREFLIIGDKKIEPKHKTDEYGNNYVFFEIPQTGDFTYTISARIETDSRIDSLRDYNLNNKISHYEEFAKSTENVESNHATVRTIALNKFASDSWLETVRQISEWTNNYVEYDWAYYPETYSTLEVIETKKGVCDEFATLSTGMLRAKGIPTRFVVGTVYSGEQWNFHSWNEAYNPNSGWIPIDTTYAESGLVDGTHIVMGYFPDPQKAQDSFIAPLSVQVSVEPKEVSVEIVSKKNFSGIVSINAEDIEISAGKWHEVKVEVENLLSTYNIVPVQLAMPREVTVQEKTKSFLFAPKEKKTIKWSIRVDKELKPREFLVGEYKIVSLHDDVNKGLKVSPSSLQEEQAQIRVLDIIPMIEGKELEIEILLKNVGKQAGKVKAGIKGTSVETEKEIGGLEQGKITLTLPDYKSQEYELYIMGAGVNLNTTIMPKDGQEQPVVNGKDEEMPKENGGDIPEQYPASFLENPVVVVGLFGFLFLALILIFKGLFRR